MNLEAPEIIGFHPLIIGAEICANLVRDFLVKKGVKFPSPHYRGRDLRFVGWMRAKGFVLDSVSIPSLSGPRSAHSKNTTNGKAQGPEVSIPSLSGPRSAPKVHEVRAEVGSGYSFHPLIIGAEICARRDASR